MTLAVAGRRLGVTARTVRRWADEGRLVVRRVNDRGDRRVSVLSVEALLRAGDPLTVPRVAVYARVSGRGDQLGSLARQEEEARAMVSVRGAETVQVFTDVGSGLNARRRGLQRALDAAAHHEFDQLMVTHRDRLARFGTEWIEQLLHAHGVKLIVLHEQTGSAESELMDDFMALIASFSGRLYGQRSAAAKRRLLERAAP